MLDSLFPSPASFLFIHRSAWKGYSRKIAYEMLHSPELVAPELACSSARVRADCHKMLGVRISMRDDAYLSFRFW